MSWESKDSAWFALVVVLSGVIGGLLGIMFYLTGETP